jgi:microcystin-dependent protein
MSDYFIGEIRAFGCKFAPQGWALCDGASLQTQQNAALYSLIGMQFGSTGTTSFKLPDLRSRTPVTPAYPVNTRIQTGIQGTAGGTETVTMTTNNMYPHTHTVVATTTLGTSPAPAITNNTNGYYPAQPKGSVQMPTPVPIYVPVTTATPADTALHSSAIGSAGAGTAHENRQPYIALNYCIALTGLYPQRP